MFGLILSLLASICWGVVYYITGKLVQKHSHFLIMSLNLPFVLFYFISSRKEYLTLKTDDFKLISLYILFGISGQLLILSAIKETDSFYATIFEILYPVFILCLMIFFGEKEIKMVNFFGIFLAILGIFFATKD